MSDFNDYDPRVERYNTGWLVPVSGYKTLYKAENSGRVVDKSKSNPREVLIDFDRQGPGLASGICIPSQKIFAIERMDVLLHPWPELIYPSLRVGVIMLDEITLADHPLLSIARPMTEPAPDLDERIRNLEAEVKRLEGRAVSRSLRYLEPNGQIIARLVGDADELTLQMEKLKHIRLRVSGWEMRP